MILIQSAASWFFLAMAIAWGFRAAALHGQPMLINPNHGIAAALIGLLSAAIALLLRMPSP